MPITRSGRLAPLAISEIGMAEVLLAKMQWAGVTASISCTTLCFTLMSSNTASITMSAWEKCFFQDASPSCRGTTRAVVVANSNGVMRFLFSFFSRSAAMLFSPRAAEAASLSFSSTRYLPLAALTWAMPPPMRPAPSTPMFWILWLGSPNECFFTAVVPWKRPISASDSGVAASWENLVASSVRWVILSLPTFCCTTSRMAYGAG
mmetsp:Transcript_27649/g.60952  ORF Transcript_27649/g.60952 Transcript_27649/m.60952 type:complete len:206 (+) Transcript_27649:882-1499(+)